MVKGTIGCVICKGRWSTDTDEIIIRKVIGSIGPCPVCIYCHGWLDEEGALLPGAPDPPPRYDDEYKAGVKWLNSL